MTSTGRGIVGKSGKKHKKGNKDKKKGGADVRAAASQLEDSVETLRATPGFHLAGIDTAATPGFMGGRKEGAAALVTGEKTLSELQEKFFANSLYGDNRKILLILQAMDTAGKGGIVRHVVGAVDPQGVAHVAFKAPTEEERKHDFLWRVRKELPKAGKIGVFDRSHYEDVLIARVRQIASTDVINERYEQINQFEREVADDDTTIIKVMLHISLEEQKARLAQRLERPDKFWKYDPGDVDERLQWAGYQEAYQLAIERTSTAGAPWYVVPADHKWYARLVVQHLLIDALRRMELDWPPATFDIEEEKRRLAAA
jgi:PPK2 family polyphosphate:nucleotide phosphotransferase